MTPAPRGWLEYEEWHGSRGTVTGRVVVFPCVRNQKPGNDRHVLAYLPPSLSAGAAGRRYPVIYMHDGQNLFDAETGPDAEWRIDETMEALAGEGFEAIIVGVPNAAVARPAPAAPRALEYMRYPNVEQDTGGGAEDYLAFLVDVVKPLVDSAFPTLAVPPATGIAGSSLGGMVTLHAAIARRDVFGFAGVVSPALRGDGGRLLRDDAPVLRPPFRVYVDVGGREGSYRTPQDRDMVSRNYLEDARRLAALLRENGFRDGKDLLYLEDPNAVHHETAWARRSPAMLRFLLRPWRAAGRLA